MNKLPREILQLVIQNVGDDQKTIVSLNMTSRSLHHATLAALYIAPNFKTVDDLFKFVAHLSPKNASKVRKIDLNCLPHRWDLSLNQPLVDLSKKARFIEHLDLSLCKINRETLIAIIMSLPLRFLSLNTLGRVVDDDLLEEILPTLKELRQINLGKTHIGDASLCALTKHCRYIESIDISGCEQVTERGIGHILQHAQHLQYLNVQECFNFVPSPGEFDETDVDIEWTESNWEDVEE
ncbi:hypothetical protein BX666DRAFT_1861137 [Dichotomocladium elegans]|nr:hypothetical protein BX666DRAFT_1861137 [Dichotomocladium elegans]